MINQKIHIPGVPTHPIVSYSSSPLHNLNKYITNILKVYFKDENSNAKNSTTFFNYKRNVPIEDDEILVSRIVEHEQSYFWYAKHNQGLC